MDNPFLTPSNVDSNKSEKVENKPNFAQGNKVAYATISPPSTDNNKEGSAKSSFSIPDSAKLPIEIGASVVAALIVLTIFGVSQSAAAALLPKAPKLLQTLLFKIAKTGSIARWKNNRCSAPLVRDGIYVHHVSCIPLYDYLCFNSYLLSDSEVLFRVSDFDAKDTFEATFNGDRFVLRFFSIENEKEYLYFAPVEEQLSGDLLKLRLPTAQEMILAQGLEVS